MRIIYENNHMPASGKYCNAVVEDSFNGFLYLYDSQGTWTELGLNYLENFSIDGGTA